MSTLTIRRKPVKTKDVIVIPRKEYKALLELKKLAEFAPTTAQKKALLRAEQNLQKGKTLSYYELAKKLGFAN